MKQDTAAIETPAPAPGTGAASDAKPEPGRFADWPLSLALLVALFVIDHATKFWAEKVLKPGPGRGYPIIEIIPGFFDLQYHENTGAAFSMATGQTKVLALVSLLATIGFSWFWWTLPARERWGRCAVALVLSGAIGNMIDRVGREYVVDFIHFYFRGYHYPIFNVADMCICIGAGIILWRGWKGRI